SVDAAGHWSFNLASPDYLAAGDQVKAVYTVTVTDDQNATTTQDVTITITGTKDAPVITSTAVSDTIAETNSALTDSGAITFTDADHNAVDTASYTGSTITPTGLTLSGTQLTAFQNAFSVDAA